MADVYTNSLSKPKGAMTFYSDFGDGESEASIIQQRQGNESPSFIGPSQFNGTQPELTNELSAPYEVPQFPIEQIEKKLAIQRQLNVKVLSDRRSHYEPSVPGDEQDHSTLDENELYVPHFQRVSISGEDTSGVPLEDLERASRLIVQALEIRKRYMKISHQSFSATAARFLDPHKQQPHHDEKQTIEAETVSTTTPSTSRSPDDLCMTDSMIDVEFDNILTDGVQQGNNCVIEITLPQNLPPNRTGVLHSSQHDHT